MNYADPPLDGSLQPYHGKAVALDINDRHAPFPAMLLIHEMRVRGFHPFQPPTPSLPTVAAWQDWILTRGVYDENNSTFRRGKTENAGNRPQPQPQLPPGLQNTSGGSTSHTLALNQNVVNEILAATRAMPSWKACELEGTSWAGTAEENIEKYNAIMSGQGIWFLLFFYTQ